MKPWSLVICLAGITAFSGCDRASTEATTEASANPTAREQAQSPDGDQIAVAESPSLPTVEPANVAESAVIGHDDGVPTGPQVAVHTPGPNVANSAESFDRAAYLADVAGYCAKVRGDRAWEVALPAADVPFLTALGGTSFQTRQGDRLRLSARTQPGMPVTWTTLGFGEFASTGQGTVTVAADASGVAHAEFRCTNDVVGAISIQAASPVCGNAISYLIYVQTSSK